MARNKYAGICYLCQLPVEAGTGHFERRRDGWRVKHANYEGRGAVTCAMASRVALAPQANRRTPPSAGKGKE